MWRMRDSSSLDCWIAADRASSLLLPGARPLDAANKEGSQLIADMLVDGDEVKSAILLGNMLDLGSLG